jgi:MFS family permease
LTPAKLLWGLSAGTYWFGWYSLVGKLGVLGEYGRALGTASFLGGVASFLAPVIGGLLISLGGYQLLFLTAIGLIFLALLSLLALEGEKTHQDMTPREVLRLFFSHSWLDLKRVEKTAKIVDCLWGKECVRLVLASNWERR